MAFKFTLTFGFYQKAKRVRWDQKLIPHDTPREHHRKFLFIFRNGAFLNQLLAEIAQHLPEHFINDSEDGGVAGCFGLEERPGGRKTSEASSVTSGYHQAEELLELLVPNHGPSPPGQEKLAEPCTQMRTVALLGKGLQACSLPSGGGVSHVFYKRPSGPEERSQSRGQM